MGHMIQATEELMAYLTGAGARETAAQIRCREETATHKMAVMQIAPEQGAFLALLARLIGAVRCVEVGTFTGYSALSVAQALPPNGHLIALDVSREWTDKAKEYWRDGGVEQKIELRIGPALESLDTMIAKSEGPFDFFFIDADKTGYDAYYERALKLLRSGGLIALDNMLYSGTVADPLRTEANISALRVLNAKIKADDRVDMALATVGDGVMLARKR